ncbi:ribosomal large subunit pseudouridine synthase F [Clostridium homopropionicum DSM 5847]|uniref:Pseudouridine synthase n=1 Tax=Clostridium homopropionicum DSM 5847 TaxID=1121318 RepID=A0A0L6Z8X8_9CLOT|nr:pseudouridine synthase [Clostridium homopropionicum]KOA19420.1 ribosomal large subunit pseudouridine synthase F [Clostridium homopropionicum DSM 5847]SFG69222.1 23S rRNA pseudouridine2604 synthase [Clostridium homopropionicum]
MRINKLFSNLGICSRKETNRIIAENRVTVNGQSCTPGQWVELEDVILIDNKPLPVKDKIYIALNKPVGVTCTALKKVENNIISFVNHSDYIFPVGRLDKASQGLMLMTNDGDLSNKITKAENMHEKEYIVTVDKPFDDLFIEHMSKGVEISKAKTRPCIVSRISEDTFRIILTQGINKQIRKMSKALGYKVIFLKRIRILNIKIDGIDLGKWRNLYEEELSELKRLVNY